MRRLVYDTLLCFFSGATLELEWLVNELGASDADVDRGARFTNEGGMKPATAKRRHKEV